MLKLSSLPAVLKTFTNAKVNLVIIGNDVPPFYNKILPEFQVLRVFKEKAKSLKLSNHNVVQRVMTTLAEIFTPIIPAY